MRPDFPRVSDQDRSAWADRNDLIDPHLQVVVSRLVPLLDGTRRLEDVCGAMLECGCAIEQTFAALAWLDSRALLGEGEDSQISAADRLRYDAQMRAFAMWSGHESESSSRSAHTAAGAAAQVALGEAQLVLFGGGRASSDLERLLEEVGVTNTLVTNELSGIDQALPCDLLVYCSDLYDRETCTAINDRSLADGFRWIMSRRDPCSITVGPLFIPRETACFECLQHRVNALSANPEDRPSSTQDERTGPIGIRIPLGLDILCLEIVKILTSLIEPVTYGRLWRLDVFSGLQELHPVLKLPRCPACGSYRREPPRELWRELYDQDR